MGSIYPILRAFGRSMLPPRLRDHIDIYSSFRDTVERPVEIESPENDVVFVLAPHPDDEMIACGGALLRHIDAGARVHVCYVMDGRQGGGEPGKTEDEIAATRKREAKAAGSLAGFSGQFFLELRDRDGADTDRGARGLRKILDEVKPGIVYLPSILDQHPEHVFASRLFIDASAGLSRSLRVRLYEVWTPLVPSHVIAIDHVLDRKNRAISLYESQLREVDLAGIAEGLSRYRGFVHLFRECHAEAFLCCTLAELLRLARLINIRGK